MPAGPSTPASQTAGILAVCDAMLGEIGRREHRFGWLREPDAPAEEWVVVDAYYPANRVVVCASCEADERQLCEELVPQHGLYLLSLDPEQLPEDPEHCKRLIADRLAEDGWTPRPAPKPVAAQAAQEDRRREPERTLEPPDSPARHGAGTGLGLGLTLIVVAVLEAYLGVVLVAFNSSQPVLGFGLLLDACTRVVGTIGAAQRHDDDATWGGLLIGSPVLVGQPKPTRTLAIAALAVTALGVILAVV